MNYQEEDYAVVYTRNVHEPTETTDIVFIDSYEGARLLAQSLNDRNDTYAVVTHVLGMNPKESSK